MRRAALGAALALAAWAAGAAAQTPDSLAQDAPPPAVVVPADTLAAVRADSAAADSLPSARRALTRSLLVPGWGQVTNGRPVRAAVAAGAVVGAAAFFVVRQREYGKFQRAALYAGCLEVPDREACADVAYAEAAWRSVGEPAFAAVAPVRDRARGRRDIAGLAVALVWAVQALDAYVGAELADFDVGEDLSLRVAPSPAGPALAARLRF